MNTKTPCTCTPPRNGQPASSVGCPCHDRPRALLPETHAHVWGGGADPACVACGVSENLVASPHCAGRP